MKLTPPTTMTPSKMDQFKKCPLAFQFGSINGLRTPKSNAALIGTVVHKSLETLLNNIEDGFTLDNLAWHVDNALETVPREELADGETSEGYDALTFALCFKDQILDIAMRIFRLEGFDPGTVTATEQSYEMDFNGLRVRGIIDLIQRVDGKLTVVDWKTGKAPRPDQVQSRMAAMNIYSMLAEANLGERPDEVKLIYLSTDPPTIITTHPNDRSNRATRMSLSAVWEQVLVSCERGEFRARPTKLCDWCDYKEWCPIYGGDPSLAPVRVRE